MTDKDFDRLLKDSLTSDDVPESLNESLILLAKSTQNKKAKIFKFVKAASSCAAVFVCAVAVLSYFNSDLFSQKNTSSVKETITDSQKDELPVTEKGPSKEPEMNSAANKAAPIQETTPNPLPKVATGAAPEKEKSVTSEEVFTDSESYAEKASDTTAKLPAPTDAGIAEHALEDFPEDQIAATRDTFSMRKTTPAPTLDMLFNQDYDYKTAISEKIATEIANLPYAQEITFSAISGNEQFSLNEENLLTIQFAAGTIAPAEHGDLFFTVGKVQDGVLVE